MAFSLDDRPALRNTERSKRFLLTAPAVHSRRSLSQHDLLRKTRMSISAGADLHRVQDSFGACSPDDPSGGPIDESCFTGESCVSSMPSFVSDASLLENAHVLAKVDSLEAAGKGQPSLPAEDGKPGPFLEGGYMADFQDSIDSSLKCCICLLVLRNAMQTPCGHRFCQSCIEPVLSGKNPVCPVDRKPLIAVFPDSYCQREILGLAVKCDNFHLCNWQGQLKDLERHREVCDFEPVECENDGCGKKMERHRLQQHMRTQCMCRVVSCHYCDGQMMEQEIEGHVRKTCPKFTEPCPNEGCNALVTRSSRKQHLEEDCSEMRQSCSLGCGEKLRRADVAAHLASAEHFGDHIQNVMNKVTQLERRLEEKTAVVERQQEEIEHLKAEMEKVKDQEGLTDIAVDEYSAVSAESMHAESKELVRPSTLRQRVATLERNVADAVTESTKNHECQSELLNTQAFLVKQVDDQDLRLLELEKTSYTGTLVWRLENFERILQDAKDGKKLAHYSPPFYAGKTGYKMCARLYPNGDGAGLGKFLSVFFVVMAGDYDNLNPWPFSRQVRMALLDQSSARRHITEVFKPDLSSSSFKKPVTGMNVASGCPRFAAHKTLTSSGYEYVKGDVIYLKISIDMTGITV